MPTPEQIGELAYAIGRFLGDYTLPILCCGILPAVAIFGASYALYVNIKQRRAGRATEHEQQDDSRPT